MWHDVLSFQAARTLVRFPSPALSQSRRSLYRSGSCDDTLAPVRGDAFRTGLRRRFTSSGSVRVTPTPRTLQGTSKATRTVGTDLAASYGPVQALVALLGSKVPPSPGKYHSTSSYAGGPPLQLPRFERDHGERGFRCVRQRRVRICDVGRLPLPHCLRCTPVRPRNRGHIRARCITSCGIDSGGSYFTKALDPVPRNTQCPDPGRASEEGPPGRRRRWRSRRAGRRSGGGRRCRECGGRRRQRRRWRRARRRASWPGRAWSGASTPNRSSAGSRSRGSPCHRDPQRSSSRTVTGLSHPTAQALERDVAATPESPPTWDSRPGTGTLVHAEPFHSRITPFVGPSPEPACPTAHALPVGRAATPERLMLSCCDVESSPHVCPFHRSTRGVPGPHPQLLPSPTANTGRSGEASTPRRTLPRP